MRRRVALALPLLVVALTLLPSSGGAGGTSGHPPAFPTPVPVGALVHPAGADPLAAAPSSPEDLGASARMLVDTTDATSVPNDGVATNLTAFANVPLPPDSSFQTGVEEVIGSYEAVFGLFTNTVMAPTAFYTVFTNTSDQTVRLEYWSELPVIEGAPYDFVLQRSNGTVWTLTVNGEPFDDNSTAATFDYGALAATWLGGLTFSELAIYSSRTTVPVSYLATSAIAVHLPNGGWYLPKNATATYTGPDGASWGVEGRLELGSLAPGEVQSGTSLAPIRNSSELWNGGAIPISVTLSFSAPSVLGLGVVGVTVNVSTLSGAPLGGVPVYVDDTLGGSASPSTLLSGEDGGAATLLTAPNESASSTDVVSATVTILGFTGSTSGDVTVLPPVQVVVESGSSVVTISPNSNTTVTFRTLDTSGNPYPAVALSLTPEFTTGTVGTAGGVGVTIQPDAGITDANGSFTVTLSAPPTPGGYAVLATVVSLGAWGHGLVNVTVRTPPVSFWAKYGPSRIVPALAVVAAAILVALAVLWLRRRPSKRQPLPEMDLRRLRAQTLGAQDEATGPPEVSRTPPGSGSP
jgi:hypothetical protein